MLEAGILPNVAEYARYRGAESSRAERRSLRTATKQDYINGAPLMAMHWFDADGKPICTQIVTYK